MKIPNNYNTNTETESQNQHPGISFIPSILVFATTIDKKEKVVQVRKKLLETQGIHTVDVDLEDWENILRVVCESGDQAKVIEQTLIEMGIESKELT